jgi:hypothetical protein
VAPFHPLRYSARAVLARAGAALAVFAAIAAVLLAGGARGPLTDAEATKGKHGTGTAVVVEQVSQLTPPVDVSPPRELKPVPPVKTVDPVVPDEPAAGAPGGEGSVDGGPVEGEGGNGGGAVDQPEADGDDAAGGNGDADAGGDGANGAGGDGAAGAGGGEGSAGGGDVQAEGGDGGDFGEPDFADRRNRFGGTAGGAKGPEPTAGDSGDYSGDPEPAGRPPLIVQPAPTAGANPSTPGDVSDDSTGPVGTGVGNLVDVGDNSTSDYQLTASPTQTGSGGNPDATGGGDSVDSTASDSSEGAPPSGATSDDTTGNAGADGNGEQGNGSGSASGDEESPDTIIPKPVTEFVRYIPDSVKGALAALAALSLLLAIGYLLAGMRARRLSRQRRELLQEVGLLQSALLPPVPEKVGALRTSVAYRPADGPGAGGDFYDVLPLAGGRVGFILGDVSGHGRGALARTAFMRYTLRAYLEAGLEPRVALQVAGRVIDDNLGGDFATVLLAVHDPDTGSLTYASAGHPAPIVVGPQTHEPVTAGSSPPIGVGVRTGLRQTTVPLVSGSVAALFTDGLMEARTDDGILGRERLAELLDGLGDDASARGLIESVAAESTKLSDDMAAVIVSPTAGVTAGQFRTEQLELSARELEGPISRRFLEACGLSPHEVEDAEHDARLLAERFGGVVLHVVFGNRTRVEVLPRNVESIEAASRRVTAGTAR